jgi:hypothetical protein
VVWRTDHDGGLLLGFLRHCECFLGFVGGGRCMLGSWVWWDGIWWSTSHASLVTGRRDLNEAGGSDDNALVNSIYMDAMLN